MRDVAAAYLLLLERGRGGDVYNVGSGVSYSMQTVLDRLVELAGVDVEVRRRPDLLRRTDTPKVLVGAAEVRAGDRLGAPLYPPADPGRYAGLLEPVVAV